MSEADECVECGGLKNRYGLFGCDEPFHPSRTVAENCMADIESDMRDRRGFGFGSFDDDVQWKIRDAWIGFIEKAMSGLCPVASSWRSIETAPKDGRLILIRERSGRVQVARWCCPDGYHSDWYVQLSQSGAADYPTCDVVQWAEIPE